MPRVTLMSAVPAVPAVMSGLSMSHVTIGRDVRMGDVARVAVWPEVELNRPIVRRGDVFARPQGTVGSRVSPVVDGFRRFRSLFHLAVS